MRDFLHSNGFFHDLPTIHKMQKLKMGSARAKQITEGIKSTSIKGMASFKKAYYKFLQEEEAREKLIKANSSKEKTNQPKAI